MASSFGVQFNPAAREELNGMRGRNGASARTPVQQAIQMLSLRLPRVYGSQALAPAPLLTGPGGMGQPGARGDVSAQALAMLAGVPYMPSSAAPTIPSAQEDRERGIFRPLPQPAPRDPSGTIRPPMPPPGPIVKFPHDPNPPDIQVEPGPSRPPMDVTPMPAYTQDDVYRLIADLLRPDPRGRGGYF